ncbi:Unknown protein, partial [Striga hermonthica]
TIFTYFLIMFTFAVFWTYIHICMHKRTKRRRINKHKTTEHVPLFRFSDRLLHQLNYMRRLVDVSDTTCLENLRMDRNSFGRLCYLLESSGGLRPSRNVAPSEQIAIFLSVLAHHKKNVTLKLDFVRSGRTISKYFNRVLDAVIRVQWILAVHPKAVEADCVDERWKWFKGCLGALDGTYIDVRVPSIDKARYRNRKGSVSVNVLGVCDKNMNFVYMLSGWEGSVADSRVLRDAVTRTNGLRVSNGNYYLVDGGYTNGPGFLAPYRGVRYHLQEWGTGNRRPRNFRELYNLRHAKARNVIERAFGILKMRWAILRSCSYYTIRTQNRIIMACALLHNFIRTSMANDPMEALVPEIPTNGVSTTTNEDVLIDQVEASPEWTQFRDRLAQD